MNKELQEFKVNVESARPTPENAQLLERLRTQIDNMESTFMELRGEDNPANKIFQWFRNHFATKEEYSCFDIRAKDQTFEFIIYADKAFNLDLSYDENSWRPRIQRDWDMFRHIATAGVMYNNHNGWFPAGAFEPFIFPETVTTQYKKISLEFKYSRRVFKDPEERDKFLSAFVEHIYNCCQRHKKQ